MKIAVDVRSIMGKKTGKEWYTFSLLEELMKLDSQSTYYLYARYDFNADHLPDNYTKRIIRVPIWLWHIAVLYDMYRCNVNIYLATASYIIASMILGKRIKVILTVHDLVAFLFPDKHDFKARIIEKLTATLAMRNAHSIICPSRNTQKDLERLFPRTVGKTVCIPEAARSNFHRKDMNDSTSTLILSKYNLPKQYILNIGTLAPRKNIVALLKAYAQLPITLKSVYSLVIVGGKGWYYSEIFDAVEKLNLEHNVIFTGYIDDYDLPYILSRAVAFVYPSKYEGFGLPLLEAMACGVPVISSDTPALMEVAEGVSEIVQRKNIDDIARGLQKVLETPPYREQLIIQGLERVQEYSWGKVAEHTYQVLQAL